MQSPDNLLHDKFASLFRQLASALTGQTTNLPHRLRELPEPDLLPSPGTTWLLLALACYRREQDRVKRDVQNFIPDAIPPSSDFQAQPQPLTFDLTKCCVWAPLIRLECGCGFGCASDGTSDDNITFGLSEQTDGIFFGDTIYRSIAAIRRQNAISRFIEFHPSDQTVWDAMADLETAGLVDGICFDGTRAQVGVEADAYHLSPVAVWHLDLLHRFCQRWEDGQQRLWLAASIGDWAKSHELAEVIGAAEVLAVTGPRAHR